MNKREIKGSNPNDARLNLSKSQKFFLILYPDDETLDCEKVLDDLCSASLEYAYILHDHDVTEDGSAKKPHYHVYCKLPRQMSRKSFGEHFGIMPNYIQYAVSEKQCVRYLRHLDDPVCFQYPAEQVICNYDVDKFWKDRDLDELSAVSEIVAVIEDYYKEFGFAPIFPVLYHQLCNKENSTQLIKSLTHRTYFWRTMLIDYKVADNG